jgi:hypothetical protein
MLIIGMSDSTAGSIGAVEELFQCASGDQLQVVPAVRADNQTKTAAAGNGLLDTSRVQN